MYTNDESMVSVIIIWTSGVFSKQKIAEGLSICHTGDQWIKYEWYKWTSNKTETPKIG
jgi:hypothetical protein